MSCRMVICAGWTWIISESHNGAELKTYKRGQSHDRGDNLIIKSKYKGSSTENQTGVNKQIIYYWRMFRATRINMHFTPKELILFPRPCHVRSSQLMEIVRVQTEGMRVLYVSVANLVVPQLVTSIPPRGKSWVRINPDFRNSFQIFVRVATEGHR